MKKLILILGLLLTFTPNARADKPNDSSWSGVWIYNRYSNTPFGSLTITDCKNNQCDFTIGTMNGAHTCSLEGKLKINADKAEYREKYETPEGKDEEIIVTFELDNAKRIIKIDANDQSRFYCGMQGYFIGEYENENNPLRYDTGFDCWNKDITDAEKTICASENLAQASKEMIKNYQSQQTKEWYNKRENCHNNQDCLWDFYISSIKSSYEKEHKRPLNLYEYMGNLAEDSLYYPTDFSLLTDFFIKNMPKEDYEEWTATFSQIALDNNKCANCHYHTYGVAGLYTIMESAFYISKDEIWLAFLPLDDEENEKYIIVYTLPNYEEKDIPLVFNNWLKRLTPYFPNGIKLKHFTNPKQP
ncbi:MAG: hypothetical protein J6J35_03240 [Alphaproteobacteria bacterium]|nr:hypothetical protein [Alphaproteobacteria bacterium]